MLLERVIKLSGDNLMSWTRASNIISNGSSGTYVVYGTVSDKTGDTNTQFTVDTGLSSISEFVMVGWLNSNKSIRKYCYYTSSNPNKFDSSDANNNVNIDFGANVSGLSIVSISGGTVTMKTGATYKNLIGAYWFAK